MISTKELSDSDFTEFRLKLLRNPGSDEQKEFLYAVRKSDDFVELLSDIPTSGSDDIPIISNKLTENEFNEPPSDTEQMLYSTWSEISPAAACRSAFWANLTFEHVKQGRIESFYLAAGGGNQICGAERIDIAIWDKAVNQPKKIDACVRTVLRRLGGLRQIRGQRSVYVDCPFARAWWRECLVAQASEGNSELANLIRMVVRINQTYWEKFVDRMISRNSTFGSVNVRNAFLRALAQVYKYDRNSKMMETSGLKRLCRVAGAYQGKRELSVLSNSELDSVMNSVLASA